MTEIWLIDTNAWHIQQIITHGWYRGFIIKKTRTCIYVFHARTTAHGINPLRPWAIRLGFSNEESIHTAPIQLTLSVLFPHSAILLSFCFPRSISSFLLSERFVRLVCEAMSKQNLFYAPECEHVSANRSSFSLFSSFINFLFNPFNLF